MTSISRAQSYLKEHGVDAWLLYDFRGSNPVFTRVLGSGAFTSRRNLCLIPAKGEPVALVHELDKNQFSDIPFNQVRYISWRELDEWLDAHLTSGTKVAMEYSPQGAIPIHSFVDAGTLEMIEKRGVEVVSSADLYQAAAAIWSDEAVRLHEIACEKTLAIKDEAFRFIEAKLAAGEPVTEYSAQQFILGRFAEEGLETDHGPIVGVNANSGDPHYEPSEAHHLPIHKGDWILIDLWSKVPGPQGVYCDVTWVGYAGEDVPEEHQQVFDVVTGARDAVVDRLHAAWAAGETLAGWQLDDVAREHIEQAGFGAYFTHRTGHSMGPGPTTHALGANLDNLETHDNRQLLPGTGFSVEPGVYQSHFGVRSEIDVYIDPEAGPTVTTAMQREVITLAVG
ncbi:MAG: M24 family metallopeptidase [Bacteroidota bacterium]